MLGLRPQLKPRPSLLDLITKKDIDQLSVQAPSLSRTDSDPRAPLIVALPPSPTKLDRSPTREYFDQREAVAPKETMAPVRGIWSDLCVISG